jgi:hypothetical protein
MGKDTSFSGRMKEYENCYSFKVPNRSYVIVRLDGVRFSKYTNFGKHLMIYCQMLWMPLQLNYVNNSTLNGYTNQMKLVLFLRIAIDNLI